MAEARKPDNKGTWAIFVAILSLLTALYYWSIPNPAAEAAFKQKQQSRAAVIQVNCAQAQSQKQALLSKGLKRDADAVDLEKVCNPSAVTEQSMLIVLGWLAAALLFPGVVVMLFYFKL